MIICKECKKIIVEDEDRVDINLRYLQCPYCFGITENPLNEENKKRF